MAGGVQLAHGYVTVSAETAGIPRQLDQAFGRAGERAGRAGGEAAGGGILEGLQGKAGAFGAVLGTAMAVAGVSAGGLFVKALSDGLRREKALDLTQARLGIDDATMAKIGTAAGRAYAANFGNSVEENIDAARRAINSGLLDSSATAQETQAVISQLSGISDLMGEEIPAVARAAGQAIKTGIAGSATEAFDLFAAAEQNGLNVSEDFLDTITEYGTQFRKLGLSGPEAIGLINQAVLAGARDTDVAADAIKEFSIRVVDGSKSTVEAFQTLGFNADDLTKRFATGGATARAAVGDLLGEINKIEDPVEKNSIALALFGTQFEDLGDALNQFNLDDAAASLGKVEGAAQSALNTMGGNAASSIESAKRSIQISTDAIGSALAKAFGPELAKVADWVTQHQPEILAFLAKLADGAFATADAFLSFSSISLRAFATLAEGVGPLLEHLLDPVGKVAEVIGKLTRNEGLEDLGHTLQNLESTMDGAADAAIGLADGIDNTTRPGLDRMRDSVASNIEQAVAAQEVFRALGDQVTALPDGHDIIVKENTPEVTARLEALGLKVTQIPGTKDVVVNAATADAQAKLDAWIVANTGRPLEQKVTVRFVDIYGNTTNDPAQQTNQVTVGNTPRGRYAAGGLFYGRGGPTDDANIIAISNREHLAYITRAQAANPATIPFLDAINSGWVPPPELLHGMVPGFAGGGLASKRALDYARSHDGEPYVYGGLDCSGYLSGIYNQLTGQSVRFTTASDFAALGFKPGMDPGGFSIGTNGGVGTNGHMAGTLLGTNVESDGSNGIQFGGSADGAAAFPKVWHLPRELWSPPETDDPSRQSGAPGFNTPQGSRAGSPGSGAGTGGLGGSAAPSSGGTYGGVAVPAGVVPVWVVGSGGGGANPVTPAPAESFAPQSSAPPSSAPGVQTLEQVDAAGRMSQAGTDFVNANIDQFLSDLGARRSGGAIQAIGQAVFDWTTKAIQEEIRRRSSQANTFVRR
ncbi:phage tail tape measure protein [Nocardia vulneris]|uniref:Phage tail tape measure protein domain-containing protein n=1 Tax=Nocardia vulneris TaxID=1141657 RepID=A0ABR4ZCY2_9NOCA|nr:phage tail tape measure protein [Nocardia vulneris]KIA62999.1 hypothetical protein FG87_21730 [Nocardia vulneris]